MTAPNGQNTPTLRDAFAFQVETAGLDSATLASANPGNYTASDSAITLNNPTKEGFLFQGWTCAQLGVSDPSASMTIAEGTTGALTFVANWMAIPTGGGGGGSAGSGSSTAAATEDETATDTAKKTAANTDPRRDPSSW